MNYELLNNIISECTRLTKTLSEYTEAFSREDFFSFADIEKRKKGYKHAFNTAMLEITREFTRITSLMSAVAEGMLNAERVCDTEGVIQMGEIFNSLEQLQYSLGEFVDNSERVLMQDTPSPEELGNHAKRFLRAIAHAQQLCLSHIQKRGS